MAQFIEKPELKTAGAILAACGFDWNSGMFLFLADRLLAAMERLAPDIVRACRDAVTAAQKDLSFTRLVAGAFAASPNTSTDYAVMEKTMSAAVVTADIGWSDVRSWSALWELGLEARASGDDGNNVTMGGVILVASRDKAQDVKAIVDRLKAEGRNEAEQNPRVYPPWGYYEGVDHGDRFQIKRISVKPGQKSSLQMHHHRAEHWIVVEGTANVTRDDETVFLEKNQSTYIPIGAHLGDDNIVRRDDD